MDGHSLSWNAVAAIGFCGWLIGAAGAPGARVEESRTFWQLQS